MGIDKIMNAEIYFIKEQIFMETEVEKMVRDIIGILKYANTNVLYRTIVEGTKENLEEAFLDTINSSDKIDFIIIIGGLYNDRNCLVKSFFRDKNIILEWDKLSKNAQFLYTHGATIPGFCVDYLNRSVILLPNLFSNTLDIVQNFVVPFLINKEK